MPLTTVNPNSTDIEHLASVDVECSGTHIVAAFTLRPEWRVFCHTERLQNRPPRLKLVLSDNADTSRSLVD